MQNVGPGRVDRSRRLLPFRPGARSCSRGRAGRLVPLCMLLCVLLGLAVPALGAEAGYTILDSHQGGCTYAFVDISAAGTPLVFTASGASPADDDGAAVIDLEAGFQLYQEPVSQLVVSTNGYLTVAGSLLEEDGGDFSNDRSLPAIPDNLGRAARLMVYHDDLSADATGGTARYQHLATCPRPSESGLDEPCTVIQWSDWGFADSSDSLDLEAILYHTSSEVVYQIGAGDSSLGAGATIGLQSDGARRADLYHGSTAGGPVGGTRATVLAGTAVCFIDPDAAGAWPEADLGIRVSDKRDQVAPGDSVTYSITAASGGPSAVAAATVTAAQPAALSGCTWFCQATGSASCRASGTGGIDETVDLAPGSSVDFELTCQVDVSATHGTVELSASVAPPAGTSDPASGNDSAIDIDVLAPSADLAVSINDGLVTAPAGGELIYAVVVSNAGPDTASDVEVSSTLGAALLDCGWGCIASAGSSCGTTSGTGPLAEVVSLASGGSLAYTLGCTLSPTATGPVLAEAVVVAPSGVEDPDGTDNAASDQDDIQTVGDLAVHVDNSEASLVPGQPVSYEIEVVSRGPSALVDAQLEATGDPVLSSCSWLCLADPGAACTASGSGWPAAELLSLPPGTSALYTVTCIVPGTAAGSVSVSATVAAPAGAVDPVAANDTAVDTDMLEPSSLLFGDGFESGDLLMWDTTYPR